MIKIGNNNKFNKSVIGNNNETISPENGKFVLKNIIIPIMVGLITAGIVFLLKWN